MAYEYDDSGIYGTYDNNQEDITLQELYDLVLSKKVYEKDIADGSISYAKIANASIGQVHIQEASINNAMIQDLAVSRAKIRNAAIGVAQIEDASITTAKIDNAAITRAKIEDLAVNSAKIEDASITTAKIQEAQIIGAHIANAAIDTAQIADGSITNAKIINGAIDNAKIGNAAIGTANIQTGAITTALLGTAVVDTAQLADASITDAKIVELTASKLTAGTIDTNEIVVQDADNHLVISGGRLQVFDNQTVPVERVSLGDVNNDGSAYGFRVRGADGQTVLYDEQGVYNEGITDGAITNPKIGNGEIDNRVIAANAVTADKILAGSITGDRLAANTITANEINVNTLQVGSANIIDGSITNAKIADATIDNAKIANIDASKITTGLLDASRVKIGADTVFDPNYDPTTKETPFGSQNKANQAEQNAKDYSVRKIGYRTSDTGGTYNNEWTRLGRSIIKERHANTDIDLNISGGGSDSSASRWANIHWRVKQQNAMGNLPELSIFFIGGDWFEPSDFSAVVIENSSSQTVVDLFVKIRSTYEAVFYTPINQANGGNAQLEWYENDGFIASLPSGNATSGVDKSFKMWQYPNTTFIDGGNIYTNTVTANEINVDKLSSLTADIGEITAGSINTDNVSIGNSTVTIDNNGIEILDGNFIIKDTLTGSIQTAIFKPNLLFDHSFESMRPDYEQPSNFGTLGPPVWQTIQTADNPYSGWVTYNDPRIMSIYQTGTEKSWIMFGLKAMLVNNEDYVYQISEIRHQTPYTFSLHARAHPDSSISRPRVVLKFYDVNMNLLSTDTHDFETDPVWNVTHRYDYTFTAPSNTSYVQIEPRSTGMHWVLIDGLQLVESEIATPYAPEDGLYSFIHGLVKGEYVTAETMHTNKMFIGETTSIIEYEDEMRFRVGTNNTFLSGLMFNGEARMSSMAVYNRTYGSAANIHITSDGTFGRSTSASKYKMDIVPVENEEDIFSRIQKLKPKKWFDKLAVEEYAAELTAIAEGKQVLDYEEIPIKRHYGLIAEDLVDLGLDMFVQYSLPDENGNIEPEGIEYDRLCVFLIPLVNQLQSKLASLEDRLTDLNV